MAVAASTARWLEEERRQNAVAAEKLAAEQVKEKALIEEARAGKLYRQGPKGIARVTDLM